MEILDDSRLEVFTCRFAQTNNQHSRGLLKCGEPWTRAAYLRAPTKAPFHLLVRSPKDVNHVLRE